MSVEISPPFRVFTDVDGEPLEDGYIHIGAVNQNPQAVPISVFWDVALTIPAAQPIRTLGGYPSRSGTPSRMYVAEAEYSISVSNKNSTLIYSSLDSDDPLAEESSPSNGAALIARGDQIVSSITELRALLKTSASKFAFVNGYYAAGDGGGGQYWLDVADTTSADNGGTIIVATDGGRWKLSRTSSVSVKQFGAKGDNIADDSVSIQAAITATRDELGGEIYFPTGTYKYGTTLVIPEDWPIQLSGVGIDATILKYTGTSNAINMRRQTTGTVLKSGVSNMRITGNALAIIGIDIYFGYSLYFRNVLIDNFRTGVSVEQSWSIHFDALHVTTCFEDGIFLSDEANNILCSNCEFFNNTRAGAYVIGARAVVFNGCTLETNLYGAYVTSNAAGTSHGISFIGCYIEGNTTSEIHVTREAGSSPSGINITGNYFVCLTGKASIAVRLVFVDGVFVGENYFSVGSATYAYSLYLSDSATLSNVNFERNEDDSTNGPYQGTATTYNNAARLTPRAVGRFTIAAASIATIKSFGVASITRISVGVYEITLDRPMPDTSYTIMASAENGASVTALLCAPGQPISTTVFRVVTASDAATVAEARTVNFTAYE